MSRPMKTFHQMKKDKEDALLKKREEAERKVRIIINMYSLTSFGINFGKNPAVIDFRQDEERLIPLMNSHSI